MSGTPGPFGGQLGPMPGALCQPDYMARTSKVYAIYESEMDSLSILNHVATAAFGLAGSSVSFALALWAQDAMNPTPTPKAEAFVSLGIPAAIVLAVVCLIVGGLAYVKRGGTLHTIKSESRALPSPALDQ